MEETPDITDAPDPTETVQLLKSDFELLQKAANAAFEDYAQWLELLNITPREGLAPREVMYEQVFPRVVRLIETQQQVDAATTELKVRAARFGNQTKDFGGGLSGIKVGQKITGLFDDRNRAERRAAERQERRERP